MSEIMGVKKWEELSLPKKEVIPHELDRYMKTYQMSAIG